MEAVNAYEQLQDKMSSSLHNNNIYSTDVSDEMLMYFSFVPDSILFNKIFCTAFSHTIQSISIAQFLSDTLFKHVRSKVFMNASDVDTRIQLSAQKVSHELKNIFPNITQMLSSDSLCTSDQLFVAYKRLCNFVSLTDYRFSNVIYSKSTTCITSSEYEQIENSLKRKGNFPLPHEVYSGLNHLDDIADATIPFLFKILMDVVFSLHFPRMTCDLLKITGLFNKSNTTDIQHLLEFGVLLFFPEIESYFKTSNIRQNFSIKKSPKNSNSVLHEDRVIFFKNKIVLSPYQIITAITERVLAHEPNSFPPGKSDISDSGRKVRRKSNLNGALGPSILEFQFLTRRVLDIISLRLDKNNFFNALNQLPKNNISQSSVVPEGVQNPSFNNSYLPSSDDTTECTSNTSGEQSSDGSSSPPSDYEMMEQRSVPATLLNDEMKEQRSVPATPLNDEIVEQRSVPATPSDYEMMEQRSVPATLLNDEMKEQSGAPATPLDHDIRILRSTTLANGAPRTGGSETRLSKISIPLSKATATLSSYIIGDGSSKNPPHSKSLNPLTPTTPTKVVKRGRRPGSKNKRKINK
ncbi:uncharacterized protein SAPINGB_P000546 [Magnusiomyces paraingens]|uniref:Uncharacterized protein n=1 Tax=Magnusiomyces paraingens TaxID=2606893 RepID=A0A5E8B008_9ASCO|nr:uncharacterized protein SAPINGB_P000546 [Saprochaete ingens]VVT44824.1 unnamed protein product [Saprochaete ingens]